MWLVRQLFCSTSVVFALTDLEKNRSYALESMWTADRPSTIVVPCGIMKLCSMHESNPILWHG